MAKDRRPMIPQERLCKEADAHTKGAWLVNMIADEAKGTNIWLSDTKRKGKK